MSEPLKVKERRNMYQCLSCKWMLVTRDDDDGVTPFAIQCRRCGKFAYSSFYDPPDFVAQGFVPVDAVWNKPNAQQYSALTPIEKEHVDKGGLLLYDMEGKPFPAHEVKQ